LKQSGATLVEFAVTVSLFLVLTIGIAEFSIYVMEVGRANELTRELGRIAIVSDPVCDIYADACPGDQSGLSCPGGSPVVVTLAQVNVADCSADSEETKCRMNRTVQSYLPTVEPENVELTFACSNAGLAFRPTPIPLVTVALRNFSRDLAFAGFLGIDAEIDFPDFEISRTGEDLYTEREL